MRRMIAIFAVPIVLVVFHSAGCSRTVPSAPTTVVPIAQQPTVVIHAPEPFHVGTPSSIRINVAEARPATIDFGDQTMMNLGVISATTDVAHVYSSLGTYIVTATITMPDGRRATAATSIPVLP